MSIGLASEMRIIIVIGAARNLYYKVFKLEKLKKEKVAPKLNPR